MDLLSRKSLLKVALLGCAILGLAWTISAQSAASQRHHAVFQMNWAEESAQNILPTHVTNLQEELAKDGGVAVEVVFYGPAIELLKKDSRMKEQMQKLADQGVDLVACQNSMRGRNIVSGDLLPFVREVPSGLSELVRKQEAGWAYLQ